jgi:hypothetical protein
MGARVSRRTRDTFVGPDEIQTFNLYGPVDRDRRGGAPMNARCRYTFSLAIDPAGRSSAAVLMSWVGIDPGRDSSVAVTHSARSGEATVQ